jgi:LAS superfamily LD-carboxypeptidase LdcB
MPQHWNRKKSPEKGSGSGLMNPTRKQMKALKPLLKGLFVSAVLIAAVHDSWGKELKSDFSFHDQKTIVSILRTLGPLIKDQQTTGRAPLLAWSELIQPLDHKQRNIIQHLRRYSDAGDDDNDPTRSPLVRLDNQSIFKNGLTKVIPPQYVTQAVYDAYTRMNQSMQNDLNTTLKIESGYRSPAYQLYLFLSHLPRYRFNMAATKRHVALPGQSEHGSLRNPAIDFINAAGINGEDNPRNFRLLSEYRWMSLNAHHYGFELSFPEATTVSAFEPWHWRHCQSSN